MDTLPLPPRPSLAQYRKRAKDLVKAACSDEPDAVRIWAHEWLDALRRLLEVEISPFVQSSIDRAVDHIDERVRERQAVGAGGRKNEFSLADAQRLIAVAHGFETWSQFSRHLERMSGKHRDGEEFEEAADAVVAGDLARLSALLTSHPELVRARSTRVHHATLLHYVAANGVEDFRQKTPPNAVDVARFLLDSGAQVDALADTYGSDAWQTTMNLLVSSAHPAGAGLQGPLVEILVDYGAAINGLKDDESPMMTALDFGYVEAAETLARRGARVDNVASAAALGRLDLVRDYVIDASTLRSGVPKIAPYWQNWPDDDEVHIGLALVWACRFARDDVAMFLLERGVHPAVRDGYAMTALHYAAANGMTGLMRELLSRGAPLEVQNAWGGTVLDSTAYSAIHMPEKGVDYRVVLELLIEHGADVKAAYPTDNIAIDDLFRAHAAG